jgi:hypothetical protein
MFPFEKKGKVIGLGLKSLRKSNNKDEKKKKIVKMSDHRREIRADTVAEQNG